MSNDMQARTNATEESFWSMLSKSGNEFAIYIPRIQRDYAQGRTDDATKQIRDRFVEDIFDSLVHFQETGKCLDINFIYGNIEEEDGKKRFIPIDGQQRLTTLFLLHWYFAVYSGKIDSDPEVKKRLLQFQYETRNVTGKFCRNLTEHVRIDLKSFSEDKSVSDAIKNYYWFFSDFENDASVRGMLVMIDSIHAKAREYMKAGISLDNVFDLLTSEQAPIRFLYLNIDDVGLTDSIYIKMNARGKALTHFENFKAQMRDYLSEDESFANEFIDNINGKWSEFFWNPIYRRMIKDPSTGKEVRETTFDAQMMKFFRFGMMMDYIANIDETRAFQRLIGISDERSLSYEEQVILFAEYAFLIKYANDNGTFSREKELNRWLRLVYNLVKPTLNLQLDVFFRMIRSVAKLVEDGSALECDHYMSSLLRKNYRQSEMFVFTETQVVEESIKSILMKKSPLWKSAIVASEQTFMEGQTGSLFAFTGLTDEYDREIIKYQDNNPDATCVDNDTVILPEADEKSIYYSSFVSYLEKFNMLFSVDGVRKELEEAAIFRRALLCYGGKDSYMLPPGKARQSFLDNKDRDYGFQRLLRDDNDGKRGYLKDLMDDISVDKPVIEQLEEIIDRKTFDEEERWKQYFIKMPEILNSIRSNVEGKRDPQGQWVFTHPQRFIRKNSNDDILLLTLRQTNSINRELYSYVLFLKARHKGLNVSYKAEYTDNAEKYAFYENNQGEQIHVVYKNKSNHGYCYIAKKMDDTEVIFYDTLDGILDYVAKTIKTDD